MASLCRVRRGRKPSTLSHYRSIVKAHLLPAFGGMRLEHVTTPMIERWLRESSGTAPTRLKNLIVLHEIFRRARKIWGLPVNPAADVEKPPVRSGGDINVFSPEEVWALVRAAATEEDAAIFLAGAFTGLRMGELLALR